MNIDRIEDAARAAGLIVVGALHPEDGGTIVLLGPDEPAFWATFKASAEMSDGQEDPLDRWSKRVIGGLASQFGAEAVFPSDGPPYPPFLSWALESGRCWTSPVNLLVHDKNIPALSCTNKFTGEVQQRPLSSAQLRKGG